MRGAIEGLGHSERNKNVSRGKIMEGLSAHTPDNYGKQKKTGVAIEPIRTGIEVQSLLTSDQRKRFVICGDVVYIDSGKVEERKVVAKAAGVIEQMQNSDFLAVVGKFRKIFTNVIMDRKFALFLQQQNAGRGELFGSATDIEDGPWSDRQVFFQIGQAVAFRIKEEN